LSYLVLPFLKQPTSIAHHVAAFWLIMAGMAARNIADFGAMALFNAHRDHMMTLINPASNRANVLLPLPAAILVAFSASGDTSFCSVAQQRKCIPVNHFSLSSAVPQRPLKRRVPSINGSAQILDHDFWALEPNLSANRRPD
jgi:hypothetical protein